MLITQAANFFFFFLRLPCLGLVRYDCLLLELQAKINARGHDNSMFSSSAIKPMNRLTKVLKHLTV